MYKKMMSFFVNFVGFNEPLNFRDSLDWGNPGLGG